MADWTQDFRLETAGTTPDVPPWLPLRGTWVFENNPDGPEINLGTIADATSANPGVLVLDLASSDGTITVDTFYGSTIVFRCQDANNYLYYNVFNDVISKREGGTFNYNLYPTLNADFFPPEFADQLVQVVIRMLGTRVEILVNGHTVFHRDVPYFTAASRHGLASTYSNSPGLADHFRTFAFDDDPPTLSPFPDDVADAAPISGETGTLTTLALNLATRETSEPDLTQTGDASSWWYRWTAPNPLPPGLSVVQFRVRYADYNDAYDAPLTVFHNATDIPSLVPMAANEFGWADGSNDFLPAVQVPVEAGESYLLQINGNDPFGVDQARIDWLMVAREPHDELADAIALASTVTGTYGSTFGTDGATYDWPTEPYGAATQPYYLTSLNGTVWFTWTCPLAWDPADFLKVTVDGTQHGGFSNGLGIGIWQGSTYGDLEAVGGVGFHGNYWTSVPMSESAEVVPGETYLISVGSHQGTFDDLSLSWDNTGTPTPPFNDDWNSGFFNGLGETPRVSRLTYATLQAGEPIEAGTTRSVWWGFTADTLYGVPIDYIASVIDGTGISIRVYEVAVGAAEFGDMTLVASGVDTVTFTATGFYPGTFYALQFYDDQPTNTATPFTAKVQVDGSQFPPPDNDEPAGAFALAHDPSPDELGRGELCATLLGSTLTAGYANPDSVTQDVWFTWVADYSGDATFTVNARVSAFEGTTHLGSGTGTVTITAVAGTTYLIRVGEVTDRDHAVCVKYPNPGVGVIGAWKIWDYANAGWTYPGRADPDAGSAESVVDFEGTGWDLAVDPYLTPPATPWHSPGTVNFAWPDAPDTELTNVTAPVGHGSFTPAIGTTIDQSGQEWFMWLRRDVLIAPGYRYQMKVRADGDAVVDMRVGDEHLGQTVYAKSPWQYDGQWYHQAESAWVDIPRYLLPPGETVRFTAMAHMSSAASSAYLDAAIRRVPVSAEPRLKVWDYVNGMWWAEGDGVAPGPWQQAPDVEIDDQPLTVAAGSFFGRIDLYHAAGYSVAEEEDADCAFALGRMGNNLGNFFGYIDVCPTSNAGPDATPGGGFLGCYYNWTPPAPFIAADIEFPHGYASYRAPSLDDRAYLTQQMRADTRPDPAPSAPEGTGAVIEYEANHWRLRRAELRKIELTVTAPTSWGADAVSPEDDLEVYLHPYRESATFGPYGKSTLFSQAFANGNPAYGNDPATVGAGGILVARFSAGETGTTRQVTVEAVDGGGVTVTHEFGTTAESWDLEWPMESTVATGPNSLQLINDTGGGHYYYEECAHYGVSLTLLTARSRVGTRPPAAYGTTDRSYSASGVTCAPVYTVRPPRHRWRWPARPLKGWDYVNGAWTLIASMAASQETTPPP